MATSARVSKMLLPRDAQTNPHGSDPRREVTAAIPVGVSALFSGAFELGNLFFCSPRVRTLTLRSGSRGRRRRTLLILRRPSLRRRAHAKASRLDGHTHIYHHWEPFLNAKKVSMLLIWAKIIKGIYYYFYLGDKK